MSIGRLTKNSKLSKITNNYNSGIQFTHSGSESTDGDYTVITFTSSEDVTFNLGKYNRSNEIRGVAGVSTFEYLVVAGGAGGGAGPNAGGGGGGGVRSNHFSMPAPLIAPSQDFSSAPNTTGIVTVTVGSGGGQDSNGGASKIATPFMESSVTGGGTGGPNPGGSGGGANYPAGTGGSGTAGEGNAGGTPARGANHNGRPNNSAGGGGGASTAGTAGNTGSTNPGAGGAGLDVTITGSPYVYSSGGGGGGGKSWVQWYGRSHDPVSTYPGGYAGDGGTGAGRGAASDPGANGPRTSTAGTNYGAGGGGGCQQGHPMSPIKGSAQNGSAGADGVVIVKHVTAV